MLQLMVLVLLLMLVQILIRLQNNLDSTDRWTFTGGDVSANAFYDGATK